MKPGFSLHDPLEDDLLGLAPGVLACQEASPLADKHGAMPHCRLLYDQHQTSACLDLPIGPVEPTLWPD